MFGPHIPVLAYHQVIQGQPPSHYPVTAISLTTFEAQMRYLHKQGYQTISLETAAFPQQAGSLPEKPIVITFDDGYHDFFTTAYPVLARYGFSGTVFLVTDFVGAVEQWEGAYSTSHPLLTWDEVRCLQEEGVTFGSHTRTHPHLPRLDAAKLAREIITAKAQLESRLGQPVRFLSYPYGESNEQTRAVARRAGYAAAFGTTSGPFGPFNIWRRDIWRTDTLQDFIYKLSQQYRFIHWSKLWIREETPFGPPLMALNRRLKRLANH